MNIAVATTTIHIPKVLEIYRAYGPYVQMFVAGDDRTPKAAEQFCKSINARYFSLEEQYDLYPHLSELIGKNNIGRRNIALLEAIKTGWGIIVLQDDDNFPINREYFSDFASIFRWPFTGLQIRAPGSWFDVGQLLDPIAPHRGFPLEASKQYEVGHVVQAKIGIAAGICLGNPDIGSITRIANQPVVHSVSTLLASGIVVAPDTWTVCNSQNTAILRSLAPCFLMLPQVGRYDDILASIIAQKVMKSLGVQVHFGCPFVWQQRNSHNLVRDLKQELWGYENIWVVANAIDRVELVSDDVLDNLRAVYLAIDPLLPIGCLQLAEAWLDTVESAL